MPTLRADPVSRRDLREYALKIRKQLEIENVFMFPVVQFLESLPILVDDDDLYFEVVPDEELDPKRHAFYDIDNNCICIKESVYNGAIEGCGRDRMTIIHECAHFLLLRQSGIKLYRDFDESKPVKTYCDPEWQAKCLAGELMIPAHLVTGLTSSEVVRRCGVSHDAACYQLKTLSSKK